MSSPSGRTPPSDGTPSGLPAWLRPPVLKISMSEAEQTLRIMIGGGRTLKERADRRDRFAEVKQRAEEWREACREWLQDHLGGQAVDEFAVAHRHQYVHETPNAYQGWEYLLA